MYKSLLSILFFLVLAVLPFRAQNTDYRLLNNFAQGTEASVISCFVQDRQGLLWLGSNKGLLSYDGYSTQKHFVFGERSNTRIYCGAVVDSTYLYLGADNGLLIYNYRTDIYEPVPDNFPKDIRALVWQDNILWMGTLNGLYTYNPKNKQLASVTKGLPHQTIYSIIEAADHTLYIGTYNGLCRYRPQTKKIEKIVLPTMHQRSNIFVNSLLEDPTRACIWIGTEGSLLRYNPNNGHTEELEAFKNNSIKSLALDGSGQLLVGTDNGLYVYRENSPLQHIVHDSRNLQSLSNNIVWTIFTDRESNIWLGTDYGVSMARCNSPMRYIPISHITATGEGNQFYGMLKDSQGTYWLGGTNGLIRFNQSVKQPAEVAWYKMGDKRYPLSHNRVRHLYEDRDGQLWVATDGSISRYDTKSRQFVHYNIVDNTRRYNANWAYGLYEDKEGKLWIATCLGGIFVVDKQKLIHSANEQYIAEKTYSEDNGLSSMFINQMIADKEDNIWALTYNSPNSIEKINTKTGKITHVAVEGLKQEQSPNYMLCAEDGYIWVGFPGGVMRIAPSDGSVHILPFDTFNHYEVLSMTDAAGQIWISTTDGFWVADRKTLEVRRLNISDKRFTSLFYDKVGGVFYLGTADGFAVSSPEALLTEQSDHPLILTALYVNNQLYQPFDRSIRYLRQIELNYDQNNLALCLSDLPYLQEEKSRIVYRLYGVDRKWSLLPPNSNLITYNNLNYGDYRLEVSKLDAYGNPSETMYSLHIRILPQWYHTVWAKVLYVLLCLALATWIINFFRVKNRLKMERMEKEKILEQSRTKMAFFANLSHELKMPLSSIIAPISKLLPEISNQYEKKQLEQVQQNALKLNSLIHHGLDFDQVEGSNNTLLILSQIELVSFAQGLLSLYMEEKVKEKQLTLDFCCNREKIYLEMDAVKLEVMLDNLLSNAVKYTPDGGNITLCLEVSEDGQEVKLLVTDTGIGIPVQDQPYIFQRFFQSSKTDGMKEGTGLGLYFVKTYTELHGGHVKVISKENMGTTVTISLPLRNEEQPVSTSIGVSAEVVPIETEEVTQQVTEYDEKFLANVVRLIEEHISDSELNVNALCDWANTTNKQMYRKVKQLTGMTPVEYIKNIRMKKAAMLLKQRKFTVAEVMYMVGFSNHSYFSKCFQAQFGVTPKQY